MRSPILNLDVFVNVLDIMASEGQISASQKDVIISEVERFAYGTISSSRVRKVDGLRFAYRITIGHVLVWVYKPGPPNGDGILVKGVEHEDHLPPGGR